MTAEIAILNKTAVALAADSKVTLSLQGRQKTYDTVDKLFSLSKTEPIGAMIYGNAEFIGFPWETIVKEYRRTKAGSSFATVFDWSDDFLAYLTSFFPFTASDEEAVGLSIAHAWVSNAVAQAYHSSRGPKDFSGALDGVIQEFSAQLEAADEFLTVSEWVSLRDRMGPSLEGLCKNGIMNSFPDDQGKLHALIELGIRQNCPSPNATGLVIAGFGSSEYLPSLVSYDVDGILAGRLKARVSERHDMTRQSSGVVIPFAQTDMVDRFMDGIDPTHAMVLHSGVGQLILDSSIHAVKLLGHSDEDVDAVRPALEAAANDAAQTFWDMNDRQRRDMFASPIIDMVMSLPKDELANVAESLVSLTSLQRRVSRELETVGGAIDVAVISKGDGFVWIKRKHYFEADRNLRFVNAYFHDQMRSPNRGGSE